MKNKPILLSAVVLVGPFRERGQLVVDALAAQTAIESMEIIVLDLGPEEAPRLTVKTGIRLVYANRSENEPWGIARVEALRQANAPVVAYIEDHCIPESGWTEALMEASKGPWAAISYAFKNGSPDTYFNRACFITEYGFWAAPVKSGPAKLLPGNNVAYKRELLLELGDKLNNALVIDYNVQQELARKQLPMFIQGRALAAHQNYARASSLLRANFDYALGFNRTKVQSWGKLRRIFYALLVPLVVPLLRLVRLIISLRRKPVLWMPALTSLPIILITFTCAAFGEAFGYLFGAGDSAQQLT